jgi:hypothetical protein
VALPDVYTIAEGGVLTVTAPGHLANDFDLDGDPLSWLSFTAPSNGTMSGTNPNGSFTYTPDVGFSGLEQLTYTITDGNGSTASSELLIYTGFVPPKDAECSATTLTETVGQSSSGAGQVTATFTNPDGIEAVTFTLLDNFTVTSGDLTDVGGNRWETTGSPSEVTAVLTQTDVSVSEAAYFALVESVCPTEADGTLETDFDPPHTFEVLPQVFAFDGGYPNPFRAQTTLRFVLPETADVTLSIYDVTGRRVATLVQDKLAAGTHDIVWSGRGGGGERLASGLYFAQLTAPGHMQTRRIALVR